MKEGSRDSQPPDTTHWLLPRKEPKRYRVDAQAIVEQAHVLVHEGGSAALAMRPLAAALGTSTSALYRHDPSKQWLVIAIVDHVLAEVETTIDGSRRPRGRHRLKRLSSSLCDVLTAHPHVHEILASHVAVTPSTIRVAETALTCLRDCVVEDADLVDAYNAWCGYVIGFTIIEAKPPQPIPDPRLPAAMRKQLEGMSTRDFPIVGELMPQVANAAYAPIVTPRAARQDTEEF